MTSVIDAQTHKKQPNQLDASFDFKMNCLWNIHNFTSIWKQLLSNARCAYNKKKQNYVQNCLYSSVCTHNMFNAIMQCNETISRFFGPYPNEYWIDHLSIGESRFSMCFRSIEQYWDIIRQLHILYHQFQIKMSMHTHSLCNHTLANKWSIQIINHDYTCWVHV